MKSSDLLIEAPQERRAGVLRRTRCFFLTLLIMWLGYGKWCKKLTDEETTLVGRWQLQTGSTPAGIWTFDSDRTGIGASLYLSGSDRFTWKIEHDELQLYRQLSGNAEFQIIKHQILNPFRTMLGQPSVSTIGIGPARFHILLASQDRVELTRIWNTRSSQRPQYVNLKLVRIVN